ncbi:predicted enzyme with a TIM-barrel fold [Corynebacterium renale]|uniref:YggS family pyridoxal phosphate-dependent enzyme n=1 Tax=Corynebacterium renale TaxID=1724 RepID=UPI000DA2F882|nr:YggS family pyridoxal phosphate-dependent enzyme [Corynebacterium renale]SQG65001.1 predicted enzyme with a TIM-barrel fold [Corynebacterium renale]STC97074.1 predicted enzyme with a TIM-barrel fold [Corynebacterium renale]
MDSRTEELARNLEAVRAKITAAEKASGREPGSVRLLPVTKFHPAEDIARLHELGVTAVGENREQEAREKAHTLPGVEFHMIGQIQSKKANAVGRWASAVHSIDSLKLATGINRGIGLALERGDRVLTGERRESVPCFIQISADGDTARGGALKEDVPAIAEALLEGEHVQFAGLMVVPPLDANPARVFSQTRQYCDELAQKYGVELQLSAGMSGDMDVAIAHGSDCVRVGTDILGARPLA